ncbi:uncharacterized protein TEOVI_000784300 [Trypanosoma equiperdum]|uniref:Uncharacterized protein n=4 Tax=Trypanozoon TaxID=39700 RepID=Q582N6_TRYB2|nr:hypothetical protein, conserved [Trypanosoma brucei gambiense DAL972]XP_844091.1 hypothetical protein, conserved [Trypanosoma brucei brucei TREU927]AAX80668.1 hypothetical protein, conserved [Trypanosoma brucei]RHW73512.1 hypothetical protein DPX39_030049900 [Trypanosoma brucei equiperdum]SCU68253.1 hypothetical protein, conserved [Trypanosoma equiperdum]AAZ10532.1 hypothetical protein, conserved [Trypanosoma brucei brucei TREU927]CBH10219.1 hypothetical protein, conserved [Trypanosoma bru|eukprot:XP_011772509.1 hypothetical protein, conserved [Trypanosoma brucei gambiense DAL972]
MADNEEVPPSGPRMTREETDELVRRLYDQQMERAARREEERQRQLARPFCSSRRIKKDEEENLVRRIYDVQRERFQQSKEERERRLTLELQSKDKKLPESEIQDQVDRIYNQEVAKSKARREELQKRYLPEVPPKTIGKKQLKESVERLFRVDYVKRDEELFKKHVYPYDPPTTKISRTDVEAMANRLSRRGS